jgi:hypothetical protein
MLHDLDFQSSAGNVFSAAMSMRFHAFPCVGLFDSGRFRMPSSVEFGSGSH